MAYLGNILKREEKLSPILTLIKLISWHKIYFVACWILHVNAQNKSKINKMKKLRICLKNSLYTLNKKKCIWCHGSGCMKFTALRVSTSDQWRSSVTNVLSSGCFYNWPIVQWLYYRWKIWDSKASSPMQWPQRIFFDPQQMNSSFCDGSSITPYTAMHLILKSKLYR